ncbi:MAG: Gfo/Idh/MocA family oxidoreductase [Clostridiales bacterium]|nr:Gfo/Idh/MocA family oxidoreductase [Clostridiales bacterium]
MDKVKIGIIGIGNMGTQHYYHINDGRCPELEVGAVADISEERRAWAKETMPESVAVFATADELMESGLVQAVIIAVPHYSHPELAMKAMRHGLHVMVEKPAGVYTKQVRQMNEAAAESNVVFGMMFNQRTNHIYRKMREIIQSGKYGNIRRTNWIITDWYRSQAYYNSGGWRATWSGEGGGVLLNQCPHQLDLWQWICGMPKKVSCYMQFGKWHDIEVEDDVTAYVEYENGATGVFITTTGDAFGTNRFEVQMDGAKLVAENNQLRIWEFNTPEPEFTRTNTVPFGNPGATELSFETDGQNPQHVGVLNAFAGAILRGEPLVARGEEGINGLTLSNAMHLSQWLGRPVELPLDEDLYYEELAKRVKTSRRKDNAISTFADVDGTY